jgi:pimeloyl-ACP methyl ester carboxylesterase
MPSIVTAHAELLSLPQAQLRGVGWGGWRVVSFANKRRVGVEGAHSASAPPTPTFASLRSTLPTARKPERVNDSETVQV